VVSFSHSTFVSIANESQGKNIALFGGKRLQINLRATEQRPINRAFVAQYRIDPALLCRPAINRWAIIVCCEDVYID
jgi:hypothetical protein